MARFTLKVMEAELGGTALDGIRSMSIEETVAVVDLTAAGDSWKTHDTDIPEWSGSIELLSDNEAGAGQTLRAGDSVTFEGYAEGNASGKTYYSGTVSITTHSPQGGSYNGEATTTYAFTGNGALSKAVVS